MFVRTVFLTLTPVTFICETLGKDRHSQLMKLCAVLCPGFAIGCDLIRLLSLTFQYDILPSYSILLIMG